MRWTIERPRWPPTGNPPAAGPTVQHRLGTGPEKDIGFPYQSALVPRRNAELDQRMMRHGWQSYLISTGQFAEWIDRGRPAPAHKRWSQYLKWVADNTGMTVRRRCRCRDRPAVRRRRGAGELGAGRAATPTR